MTYSFRLAAVLSCLVLVGAVQAPAMAQNPSSSAPSGLTLEHRMLLKCSAAFALVVHGQEQGQADMLGYGVSPQRGREYFVQAMAQVMEETGFTRADATEQLTQEAQRLSAGDGGGLVQIMPACLASLESFASAPEAAPPVP